MSPSQRALTGVELLRLFSLLCAQFVQLNFVKNWMPTK